MRLNNAHELIRQPNIFVIRSSIGIISIVGNGLILYIALRFHSFRLSYCNGLIALLAFGEFLLGIGLMYRAISTYFHLHDLDRLRCLLIGFPQTLGIIFSQIILLAMAIDRFLAVYKPQEYYKSENKIVFVFFIATMSTAFLGFLALYNLDPSPAKHCSTGACVTRMFIRVWTIFGVIIAVLIFGFYVATVVLFRKRFNLKSFPKKNKPLCLSIQLQRKVFVSISLILLCYAVFWCIPLFLTVIGSMINVEPYILGYISSTIGLFSGINSCVGIFIYLAKHQEMREYFMKIFPPASSTVYL